MNNTLILGITGPTGSGKSTICNILANMNIPVIDCDKISRKLQSSDMLLIDDIRRSFGKSVFTVDGDINRQALASRVFSSPEDMKKLTSLMYPKIYNEVLSKVEGLVVNKHSAIAIDAPVLFESGLNLICTKTIAVLANKDLRLKRILNRDKIEKATALLRLEAQKNDDFYTKLCDFILDGSKSTTSLTEDIESILSTCTGK